MAPDSVSVHDTFKVSSPLRYMYFTIAAPGCSMKSERGRTPFKAGKQDKEAVIMLKKILDFIEEYYAEFSHSEKW